MDPVFLSLIALIACLYSAVGHGGATGYLALMSVYGIAPEIMAGTALTLNCLTAGIALIAYQRAGYLSLKLTMPFIVISIPCAFLGAWLPLREAHYSLLLATVLILAAGRLFFYNKTATSCETFVKPPSFKVTVPVGAVLGFLSGAVGIGGGVFLSPVIILANWADAKTTSATAALFILANSISGLVARGISGSLYLADMAPLMLVALTGSLIGSFSGARLDSSNSLRRLLAIVLIVAVAKMFLPK
ncbi:MAG: sulfite exporter TauE/SafE family protein [Candidatus Obscuribacterales bacterium]|nr:sulfite exporter TauE/SafE family protein [Candidatus Obscuribacterales bacterium]